MTTNPKKLPSMDILLNQLDWNLQWLQQMEKNEATDYYRDAALQRFDFTFNTAVKCIRAGALKKNETCESPEQCFALAERMKWLPQGTEWQEIIQDYKNMTSESPSKDVNVIFSHLKKHRETIKTLFDRLTELEPKS